MTDQSKHTPGPWDYVASNENHGPYVTDRWGSDVCDCYTMSNLSALAVCNGGDSKPIHFQPGAADANARLIAAAPDLLAALKGAMVIIDTYGIPPGSTLIKPYNDRRNACLAAIAKAEVAR